MFPATPTTGGDAVTEWTHTLTHLTHGDLPTDDADRVALLRSLEELKCAAEAAQARVAAAMAHDAEQTRESTAAVAAKVAVARRVSPHRGRRLLALATVLHRETPHTAAAFDAGKLSEYRVSLLLRETAMLDLEHRQQIDAELAGNPAALEAMGDRELAARAASRAAALDPAAVTQRRRRAEADRCVTLRPAPDTMTYLTALLPVAEGVAVYAALTHAANTTRATDDTRSRGQVMADTLVARTTTQATTGQAATEATPAVPVAVNLVLSDQALIGGADDDPALIGTNTTTGGTGYQQIPAELARQLITDSLTHTTATTLRRLYANPAGLVAMESRSRRFPAGLAELITIRDQTCRTPWCDAPIRHLDHITPHTTGGATNLQNGQGLCEACNHTKADHPTWPTGPPPPVPRPYPQQRHYPMANPVEIYWLAA